MNTNLKPIFNLKASGKLLHEIYFWNIKSYVISFSNLVYYCYSKETLNTVETSEVTIW